LIYFLPLFAVGFFRACAKSEAATDLTAFGALLLLKSFDANDASLFEVVMFNPFFALG
jgi:hypothetical protein